MELHRHACGLFYSRQFADFLRQKREAEARAHPGELLSLEYVRCAEGELAGSAWWRLGWISMFRTPAEYCYRIGDTEVFIHRQVKHGLVNRLLHYADGQVVVKR